METMVGKMLHHAYSHMIALQFRIPMLLQENQISLIWRNVYRKKCHPDGINPSHHEEIRQLRKCMEKTSVQNEQIQKLISRNNSMLNTIHIDDKVSSQIIFAHSG